MSTYNTKIGQFCAANTDWEALLTAEPYFIKIKRDDGFVIFNYNQLSSDFTNEIVREARGIIFKEGEWETPVCHAFDKFFNFGEPNCVELDWSTVKVSEKIDGSICRIWSYDGIWHVSTNGMINAAEATVPDVRKDNFEDLFWEGVRKNMEKANYPGGIFGWLRDLNPDYTYIFEMVSPYTRVVIPHEHTDVYFLGARNNDTNYQYGCTEFDAYATNTLMFPRPRLYPIQTFTQVITAANTLPWDNEGYVCYDKDFNRCKIKSPKYVLAHFARNNNVITRKHLIDIILKGEMEEFLIYAADYKDQMLWTKQLMDNFISFADNCAILMKSLRKLPRAEAAEVIKKFHNLAQPIMFMNLDRPVNGLEYVQNWDTNKWERNISCFNDMLNN